MDLRSNSFIPNFFLNFMLCLAIISCGGSAGPSNQPLLDSTAGAAIEPLFNSNPIIIEDAASYYSHACNDPSFQFLIPLNINDDEHIDFISHFWCDSMTPGEYDNAPTPDALVVHLNDGYGNYSINNLSVLGEIYPKLGGASRKYAIGDINNDGKKDIAFAMNWEDGRASYDYDSMISNYARPTLILSNSNSYEIVKLGEPDWGHSVQIKNNKVFFAGHKSQVFELDTNGWNDISNSYPQLSFASFLLFNEYLINSVRRDASQGLELIKDNKIISSIMFEESFKVNFESWNNAGTNYYTELGVYNIRGENYFDGMISEMCKKEDIIVASINASKLISGEIIEGGFYSESDTTPVVMLALYKIENDKLVAFDKTIKDEEINHNYNFFDCIDVNNDNKRDITASVFSQQWNDYDNNRGVPEIYINADDHYYNLDTSNWPTYSDNEDTQGYLFDIDMSGTLDLVIFPTKVNSSSKVEIYITNKNLTD